MIFVKMCVNPCSAVASLMSRITATVGVYDGFEAVEKNLNIISQQHFRLTFINNFTVFSATLPECKNKKFRDFQVCSRLKINTEVPYGMFGSFVTLKVKISLF